MTIAKQINLAGYIDLIQNLNVNRRSTKLAPHKAILLLSVIDLIEEGIISTPFVSLSEELTHTFKVNWNRYVPPSSVFSCKLNYPFFHLSSSPFWKLEKLPSYEEKKVYSMSALKHSFSGATISQELFNLLQHPDSRGKIKATLIATYLSNDTTGTNLNSYTLLLGLCLLFVA